MMFITCTPPKRPMAFIASRDMLLSLFAMVRYANQVTRISPTESDY